MSYIGRPQVTGPYIKLDDISSQFNGSTTTFNLTSGGKPFYASNPYTLLLSLGGGGNGGGSPTAGQTNSGGGGGAAGYTGGVPIVYGGSGGSGIVIIAYPS